MQACKHHSIVYRRTTVRDARLKKPSACSSEPVPRCPYGRLAYLVEHTCIYVMAVKPNSQNSVQVKPVIHVDNSRSKCSSEVVTDQQFIKNALRALYNIIL